MYRNTLNGKHDVPMPVSDKGHMENPN
jgi:hypothetical protein